MNFPIYNFSIKWKDKNIYNGSFENASHSFVNMLLITMVFEVAIGASFTDINKRFCFEKGINNTVLLDQCERLSFS